MKTIIFLIMSMTTAAAVAAPSQQQIDQAGLEILLSSSAKLATMNGMSVAQILSKELTTTDNTHNKIKNSCVYDKNDEQFNCSLRVTNSDDNGQTESMTEIKYILEKGAYGLPSKDLFYLSVEVNTAG